jgi:hypothetical protein
MRLQEWLGDGGPEVDDFRPTDGQSQIVFDEMLSTGAVITGRRTGDFADYWGGDHHDGVPIFVPTHVGAYTAQECLKARLLDVLEIQLMPVLLGQGRLLFDGLDP